MMLDRELLISEAISGWMNIELIFHNIIIKRTDRMIVTMKC